MCVHIHTHTVYYFTIEYNILHYLYDMSIIYCVWYLDKTNLSLTRQIQKSLLLFPPVPQPLLKKTQLLQ